MNSNSKLSVQWLGHSTFVITSPGGKRIVLDPWLEGNPKCPDEHKKITEADLILITHGHPDHVGDVFSVARNWSTGDCNLGVREII